MPVFRFDGAVLKIGAGVLQVDTVPTNTAPAAVDSSFSVDQDTQYSGSVTATDTDGDALTYFYEANPDNPTLGSVDMDTGGSFTYDPPSGYFGADQFKFSVSDGRGGVDEGFVTITVTEVGGSPVLAISDVTGTSTGTTSGEISITVNKACTIYWRIKSLTAPTNKATEFNNTVEAVAAGTYGPYPNGGSLTEDTLYYASAWAENLGDAEETAIVSDTFTTGAATNSIPSNLRFAAGGTSKNVSESTATGVTIATVIADGVPSTITFAEDADPDSKFTVNSDGTIELSAAVVYATQTSHTLDVTATNSEGTSAAQTLTFNVIETSSGVNDDAGDPPSGFDYQAANLTALNSLFAGWTVTGGIIQVPGAASKVVQLTAPINGTLNLSGKKFSHKVVIRSIGPYAATYNSGTTLYTDSAFTGSDISGGVNISNCENVELFRLCITGKITGGYHFAADNAVDSGFRKCWFYGDPFPIDLISTDLSPGDNRSGEPNDTIGFYMEHNYYTCFYNTGLVMKNSTNNVIRGNIMHGLRHDNYKQHGNSTGKLFEENWACRTTCRQDPDPNDGDAAHTDFHQSQGAGVHTGGTYRYNVPWYGPRVNAAGGDVGVDSSKQGFFFGGTTTTGSSTFEQNCFGSNHVTQIGFKNSSGGNTVRYNTIIPYKMTNGPYAGGQGYSMPKVEGNNQDFNILCTNNNLSGAAGPNGVALTSFGDVKKGTFDFVALAAESYFSGSPRDTVGFEVMLPSGGASSRAHWDNANPVGCYELLERVFDLGLHPGNRGWPVAEPWDRMYNPASSISSTYTGSYDSNGDNV